MNENITRQEYQRRTNNIMRKIDEIKKEVSEIKINLATLPEKLRETFDEHYISKDSFKPIQKIVYGLVGAILLAVIVAILALVIR